MNCWEREWGEELDGGRECGERERERERERESERESVCVRERWETDAISFY